MDKNETGFIEYLDDTQICRILKTIYKKDVTVNQSTTVLNEDSNNFMYYLLHIGVSKDTNIKCCFPISLSDYCFFDMPPEKFDKISQQEYQSAVKRELKKTNESLYRKYLKCSKLYDESKQEKSVIKEEIM